MPTLIAVLEQFRAVLRVAFFVAAVVLLVVFLTDWLVRTRRINPFNPVARFFRRSVDPLLAPVERRVLRMGGLPSNAPWWALVTVVVGGILLIATLEFADRQIGVASTMVRRGPSGLLVLLVRWAFGILQLALLIRVIASWVRISEYSKWIRWTFVLTEPILRPLRRVIPTLGMIDITPLVALLLLRLIEGVLLSAIA